MTKHDADLLRLGTYLHDFLMNMDYKKTDMEKSVDIYKNLDSSKFPKTKGFIKKYNGKTEEQIKRREILDDFEDVAVEVLSNMNVNSGTAKLEIPGKNIGEPRLKSCILIGR